MVNRQFKMVFIAFLMLMGMGTSVVKAGTPQTDATTDAGTTFDNVAANVVWAFNSSSTEPASVVEPDGAFTLTTVAVGSDLTEAAKAYNGANYVNFQPSAQMSSASAGHEVEFKVVPSKGLTFTPTHVQANIVRFGTDDGLLDIVAKTAEGQTVTLGSGIKPIRNNKTASESSDATNFSFDVPAELATQEGFSLVVYIYSLGATKQIGLNDVRISGTINGTTVDVTKYTLSATANPAEGGTVTIYPAGGEYDEGTEITLTAKKNFGYKFVNWTDAEGNVLSDEAKFKLTLNADTEVTGNFEKINTYSLDVTVEKPANDYMVAWSPSPTEVDGRQMYEEGTQVTLTASSNPILTFTGWSNGETTGEITFNMTADKSLTASYSAVDFIAGWDFWQAGNSGRVADFAAADNDADQLVLRNESGTTVSWLDKSNAKGGYEGRNAAVSWQVGSTEGDVGNYYWQTKVNAEAFTDIIVACEMAYNYNAYQKQDVEYSVDGENWTLLGSVNIPGTKNWTAGNFTLPKDADNQKELYIRWKSDKTSNIDGTSSKNDGISIANIYITGTEKLVNDGKAPQLVSTVPEEGSATASANGKVVLTFDEKVKAADDATATLDGKTLTPTVSGKTVIFEYSGLEYASSYVFSLPANTVADLTDNYITEAITINFTTRSKPEVTKGLYDFIVPDDGAFRDAIAAAAGRDDNSKRFRIFVKRGSYVIPADETKTVEGSDGKKYANPTTYVGTPNVSIIGEDMETTILLNNPPQTKTGTANPIEGLRKCDVLQFSNKATNMYLQDITVKNNTEDATGRNVALTDQGDKNIFKNVCLHGYQDTYYSNNASGRFYFEGGRLRGRTDYLCGGGDVFYNGVELSICQSGGYITAPSTAKKYGYVFKDCTITGEKDGINGNYTLGRPWGSGTPCAIYIDTKMIVQPSALGWNEMSGGYPKRMAEYNSMTSTGTPIDLSGRKTVFADTHKNNPVLTTEEAAEYTIENVMGQGDNWDPTSYTEQASAPENVVINGSTITWDDNNYVFCWAVCKNGDVVGFTKVPSYDVDDATATWSVRAANEMGGLGVATEASDAAGINEISGKAEIVNTKYYTIDGIQVPAAQARGTVIRVSTLSDGKVVVDKMVK